jgi:hypothetical protein
MEIGYEVTLDDLIAFTLYHHEHSPAMRRSLLFLRFKLPMVGLLIFFLPPWSLDSILGGMVLFPLFYILWIFCIPFFYRYGIKMRTRNLHREGSNKGILGQHHIDLSPVSVTERTEFGEQITRWDAVERIVSTANYIFIYIGSMSGHVIPKRAFLNEDAAQQFLHQARENMERFVPPK